MTKKVWCIFVAYNGLGTVMVLNSIKGDMIKAEDRKKELVAKGLDVNNIIIEEWKVKL